MNNKEWFRGSDWDKATQDVFEKKLTRSKDSYNKAQYIRIKGSYLLSSGEIFKESEGCKLMERIINEYPNEVSHVMFAYEELGDYYSHKKNFDQAEFNYRKSISFYKAGGRSGSSGLGDIKLAEIIIKTSQQEKFNEMYDLLTDKFEKTGGSLSLNEDIFRYYFALAKLCDGLGKSDLAKKYATKALDISDIKVPQLDKYPRLGIIKADKAELKSLKEILEK